MLHTSLLRSSFNRVALAAAAAVLALGASACGTKAAADAGDDAGVTGNKTGVTEDIVVDVGPVLKTCKLSSECSSGDECVTVDNASAFCRTPTHAKGMGEACYMNQACAKGLTCLGDPGSVRAVCSAACETNLDCAANMWCYDRGSNTADGNDGKFCMTRRFGASCAYDEECASGVCTDMGLGAKFCSKTCDAGSFECPRFADCTEQLSDDGAATRNVCTHRSGTCIGDGTLCQPCANHTCADDTSVCLQFGSGENFCSTSCTAAADCGAGYKCMQTAADGTKTCVPVTNRCVGKLTETYKKGDIFEDYAMIGRVDSNGDGKLSDEEPTLIKLSDFADKQVIGITISAGWCGPCQAETKTFKATMDKYGAKAIIFQILIEDDNEGGGHIDTDFSLAWIKQLGAVGVSGIDPDHTPDLWNVPGTIPLNILIDAKTRKILEKENGATADGWNTLFAKYVK